MTASNRIKNKPNYSPIACPCGNTFTPKTSGNKHCSWQCRFKSIASAFDGHEGCWDWPNSVGSHGYGQFVIARGDVRTAHRLSLLVFKNEDAPKGKYVCHTCDNRRCFNPSHLFIGDPIDNTKDMWAKGRQSDYSNAPKGDSHPRKTMPSLYDGLKKFSDAEECRIIEMSKQVSLREIARRYQCSHSTIRRVIRTFGSTNKNAMLASKG